MSFTARYLQQTQEIAQQINSIQLELAERAIFMPRVL